MYFKNTCQRTDYALKYFKSAILIFTATALVFGLFWKIFPDKSEKDVFVQSDGAEEKDYKNFAKGSPLFSEGEISVSAKSEGFLTSASQSISPSLCAS